MPMNSFLDTEIIDQIIQEEMQAMQIPGLAIAIVSGSEPIYLKGFGKINDAGDKVTEKTAFIIGSSSKSFTAMAIMQMSEAGVLNIDDPVLKYLPEFGSIKDADEVTIRQLLDHTSGFSTYEGMKVFNEKAGGRLSQFIKKLHHFRLSRKPGASFEYSNLNYVLLGAIVEVVSGMSYEAYLVQNIFEPLDMKCTFAEYQKALNYGLEKGYQPVLGLLRQTAYDFHPEIIPAGYIVSCAEDMAKYLIANLNGGCYNNSRILSESAICTLHTKSSKASDHYGLGWFDYDELVHHGGSAENYHANMMLIPSRGLGIAILYNINDNISGAFVKGNFGNGETIVYDRIQSKIVNALTGENTMAPIIDRGKGFHKKTNVIFGMLFALLTLYGCMLLSSSQTYMPLVVIVNLLIPLILLVIIPRLFKASWKPLFQFAAGFAHALFALQLYLILIGVFKIITVF
ncbi:serine hydrolase domain-containing protein [Fusibacter ferrireducens]|uniref:Beta-lactamase family protein n=1 Tax=Fusibacter ferrireducens TaxID=2785058 RepID=A0ABR9ZYJ1_9FIRM|nr:serine hydrolase domain-containing protein [Fusibacter ferrireducens]MBF4695531.1 beta-lactamase family protein [Fusibacter ferrireducens]